MLPYSKYTTFVMQFVLLKFICITKVVSVISWRFNLVRFLGDCGHMQRFNWQKNLQLHSLLFDFIHQNLSVLKVFSFIKRALVIVSKRSRIICNPKFSISNNFIYRDSSLTSPSLFLLWSVVGVTRLGDLLDFGQLFKAFEQQSFYPNLLPSKAIFVKVSKVKNFLVISFLGNFYRHLTYIDI